MSRSESVERLTNSRVVPEFFWFSLDDKQVQEAFDMYQHMKAEGEDKGGTLRVYPGLSKDGSPELHLVLVDAAGNVCGEYNSSHPCPPICP